MDEEIVEVEGQELNEEAGTPDSSAETKKADTKDQKTVPYSRFSQVNEQLKSAKEQLAAIEKERKAAEIKAQEEQGHYRELYEKAQQELAAQKQAVAALEFDSLRKEIAAEAGYPALWGRLQGTDRAELESDMKNLLDAMPKPKAPPVNGAAGTNEGGVTGSKMTAAEKKEFAATFGLRPEYIPD